MWFYPGVMSDSMPKHYSPADVEARWSETWLREGYFHADASASSEPYTITLPPPNVTGSLHMGHALGSTIQDTLIRWQRMRGKNAMWMPGMDHAGIATQMLVERDLMRKEEKSRHDLGRDAFLERVWAWKERFGGRIKKQEQTMGFSLDWPRERFTMDEKASRAVREVFVRLYEDGLIYRAHRLVNWCTDCFTAISDLEVNNEKEKGFLWELKYPIVGTDEFLIVATTRPETMLGDTGVAVHPDDERYQHLIGKMVRLPLCDREIPVVGDTFVEMDFGSGAVKVTPGHDQNDFECGQRCNLPLLSVIDHHGKIIAPAPEKYRGMTVAQARKAVVADMEEQGFLGKVEDYEVARGRCDRSKTVIEPLVSDQWFCKMKPLAEPAIEAVREGKTRFVPELWTKTYMHWMTNIRDWCISRQLWWGHRIPAWHCENCQNVMVARDAPTDCTSCQSTHLRQDEDVLDTWFSSGLWPFSTLGWPDKTPDLATFYPNATMVTGPDIIFFWVARMMMMGLRFMGEVPFKDVYFTPIIMDENGEKMSKTKGNVIDPLDVVFGAKLDELLERAKRDNAKPAAVKNIKKLFAKGINPSGADALRFSLLAMTLPGRNIRLSMDRIEGYRHFINKLWNASRFALMNLSDFDDAAADRFADALRQGARDSFMLADRWILSRLQQVSAQVHEALSAFRFSDAANALYHFVWHELCDWYIELAKPHLRTYEGEGDDATRAAHDQRRFHTQGTLAHVLEQSLRLLHPLTPYVTEEIWSRLPRPTGVPASLMIADYPVADQQRLDTDAEAHMALLQEVTVAVRNLRATYGVPPQKGVTAEIRTGNADKRAVLAAEKTLIERSARATLTVAESGEHVPHSAKSIVGADIEVIVPLEGLVDLAAERARIQKELKKNDKEIKFLQKKLGNQNFIARAPAAVVEKERARLIEEEQRKERLTEALEVLQ